ncbi:MAG: M15 family metallopeptidase [Nocardioidaceae bacterium]
MKRTRLLATTTVLVAGLVGPLGSGPAASAEDPSPPAPSAAASTAPADPTPAAANTAPVAVDDPASTVVAGRSVTVAVLANDTDDGQGRPAGETQHLEIGTFDRLAGRVTEGATHTTLTFTARLSDAGRSFRFRYTASDGSLVSNIASTGVDVTVPPPVARTVSLTMPGHVVALRTYVLRGSVAPVAPGPATVAVQRLVGSRWTTYGSAKVGGRGGYAVRFSTDLPVHYVFRAVATWRNGATKVSPRLTRSVLARVDAVVSGPLTRSAVRWSYRSGCPVTPGGLREVTVNRFTYRHVESRGTLVVRASSVPAILRVFRASFSSRFPVRSMRTADAFYAGGRRTPTGSDIAAMKADNTSAFNCRPVTGNPYRVSQHSYGNAIDINTVRNPYVVGSRVYPSFARTYLNRSRVRTGMITPDGVVATQMRRNGWPWGARWAHPDYQHFSSNGG